MSGQVCSAAGRPSGLWTHSSASEVGDIEPGAKGDKKTHEPPGRGGERPFMEMKCRLQLTNTLMGTKPEQLPVPRVTNRIRRIKIYLWYIYYFIFYPHNYPESLMLLF